MAADRGAVETPPFKMAPEPRAKSWKTRLRDLASDALPRAVLVRRGAARDRRLALTFDDGPGPMTDGYLDVLGRFGVRATFFVLGSACAAHRDALWRIVARGHEVAGHGFSHRAFTTMDAPTLQDELSGTAALLPPPRSGRPFVRPPFGSLSVQTLARSAAAGYTTVLWSLDSNDCRTASADEIVAGLAPAKVSPGDIVLLHEEQAWTLEALPRIIERLMADGWQLVPVGELVRS